MSKLLIVSLITSLFTFSAWAATPVHSDAGLKRLGSVSASGATTLSGLEKRLSKKADEAGARAYRIVAAGGVNKLYGVAIIYK